MNAGIHDDQGSRLRRLAILIGAGALVVYGRRSNWAGRVAASLGAALAARALAGHDDLAPLLARRGLGQATEAAIDDMGADSFPASDPPSYTSTVGALAR
jgi:uncharacterized membrane protein